MLLNRRVMSARDNARVSTAVEEARGAWQTYAPYLELFRAELRRARTVSPGDVPADVVTMNSRFALTDPRTDETICYTLAYPDAADGAVPQVVGCRCLARWGWRCWARASERMWFGSPTTARRSGGSAGCFISPRPPAT